MRSDSERALAEELERKGIYSCPDLHWDDIAAAIVASDWLKQVLPVSIGPIRKPKRATKTVILQEMEDGTRIRIDTGDAVFEQSHQQGETHALLRLGVATITDYDADSDQARRWRRILNEDLES